MTSDNLLLRLIAGGFLKEHTKDAAQAEKLLVRAFRDLKTAEAFVREILKRVRGEMPQLELDFKD